MKVCLKRCLGLQAQWTSPADVAFVCGLYGIWSGAGQGHDLEDTCVSAFREGKRGIIGCTHAQGKLHIYLTVCDSFFRETLQKWHFLHDMDDAK